MSFFILPSDTQTPPRPHSFVPDAKIEPRSNDVLAGVDMDPARNDVSVGIERALLSASHVAAESVEVGMQEFQFYRPRARDHHLDACADGPTEIVGALPAQGNAGNVCLQPTDCDAGGHIGQDPIDPIERIA